MEWLDTAIIPNDFWVGMTCSANPQYTGLHDQTFAFPQSQELNLPALNFTKSEVNDGNFKWSTAEDTLLLRLVKMHGNDWVFLANYFSGKSPSGLRRRWTNKLDPKIKKQRWTNEEDDLILKMFQEHGGNWKLISQKLEGRPPTVIKNHFYGALKRRVSSANITVSKSITKLAEDSIVNSFLTSNQDCDESFDLMSLKLPVVTSEELTDVDKEDRLKHLYKRMTTIEVILKKAQQQIRKLEGNLINTIKRS